MKGKSKTIEKNKTIHVQVIVSIRKKSEVEPVHLKHSHVHLKHAYVHELTINNSGSEKFSAANSSNFKASFYITQVKVIQKLTA